MVMRVIDSGLKSARDNLAITESLCRLHRAGAISDTLRFQHFHPSAIIGRHQRLEREVNLAWCKAHQVATARRMTGGGAIIMGPGLLGWELIAHRHALPRGLGAVTQAICQTVASALQSLGINAAFRPRNDVEVDGRKICGTGGYYDGDTLVFQGTIIMRLDHDLMANALHLPSQKLAKRGLTALSERVTDLASLLKTPPDLTSITRAMAAHMATLMGKSADYTELGTEELALAGAVFHESIGTDDFVAGRSIHLPTEGRRFTVEHLGPNASFEAVISLHDGMEAVIDQIALYSDALITPSRSLLDLEAALRHIPLKMAADTAQQWLMQHRPTLLGADFADLITLLRKSHDSL